MKNRREFMDEDAIRERMGLAPPSARDDEAVSAAQQRTPEAEDALEGSAARLEREADDLPSAATETTDAAPRDVVETRGGDVRGQRSTEEHGAGLVETPGANVAHQRLGGPGPDYPESHSEPPAEPERHPGGDTESVHGASEAYVPTRDHDAIAAAEAGRAMGHTDFGDRHPAAAASAAHAPVHADTHAPAHGTAHAVGDPAGHAEGHGEPRLGPIDTAAWGASLLGVAVGAAIAFLFYLATV